MVSKMDCTLPEKGRCRLTLEFFIFILTETLGLSTQLHSDIYFDFICYGSQFRNEPLVEGSIGGIKYSRCTVQQHMYSRIEGYRQENIQRKNG
jgi:hypothetical protein